MTSEQIKQLEKELPKHHYDEIMECMEENNLELEELTPLEAFDATLKYIGIIGFTTQILNYVNAFGLGEDKSRE